MSTGLSNLEKFGTLARKFLHDTSNDYTAIGLNLHFLEKAIEPEHPAYKDFQNLASALKNLQGNIKYLLAWRRQLPDGLTSFPIAQFPKIVTEPTGWDLVDKIPTDSPLIIKFHPMWMDSLIRFAAGNVPGKITAQVVETPNDQCITPLQMRLIFEPSQPRGWVHGEEIDWCLYRELVKLMGGGLALIEDPAPAIFTVFLPLYPAPQKESSSKL